MTQSLQIIHCFFQFANRARRFLLLATLLLLLATASGAMSLNEYLKRSAPYLELISDRTMALYYLMDLAPLLLKNYKLSLINNTEERALADLDSFTQLIIERSADDLADIYQELLQNPAISQHSEHLPENFDRYTNWLDQYIQNILKKIEILEIASGKSDLSSLENELNFILGYYPMIYMSKDNDKRSMISRVGKALVNYLHSLPSEQSEQERTRFAKAILFATDGLLSISTRYPDIQMGELIIDLLGHLYNPEPSRESGTISGSIVVADHPELYQLLVTQLPGVDASLWESHSLHPLLELTGGEPGASATSGQKPDGLIIPEDNISSSDDEGFVDEGRSFTIESGHESVVKELKTDLPKDPRFRDKLKKLSEFSVVRHDSPHIELYGSQALLALWQELYPESEVTGSSARITPGDWDFKIYRKDLGRWLELLDIETESRSPVLAQMDTALFEPMMIDEPGNVKVGLSPLPTPDNSKRWFGVNIKWYQPNSSGQGFSRPLSIDLTFTQEMDNTQVKCFHDLGSFPVIDATGIITHYEQLTGSSLYPEEKHVRRIRDWQQLEARYQKLTPEVRQRLNNLLAPKQEATKEEQPAPVSETLPWKTHHYCMFCRDVLTDPQQVEVCGALYCRGCIDQLENDSDGNKICVCPAQEDCGGKFSINAIHADRGTAREIEKIRTEYNEEAPTSGETRPAPKPLVQSFVSLGQGLEVGNFLPVEQRELTYTLNSPEPGARRRERRTNPGANQFTKAVAEFQNRVSIENKVFKDSFPLPEDSTQEFVCTLADLQERYQVFLKAVSQLASFQTELDQILRLPVVGRARGQLTGKIEEMKFHALATLVLNWSRLAHYASFMADRVFKDHLATIDPVALNTALQWDTLAVQMAHQYRIQEQRLSEDYPKLAKRGEFKDENIDQEKFLEDMYLLVYQVFTLNLQSDLRVLDCSNPKERIQLYTHPILTELMRWRDTIGQLDNLAGRPRFPDQPDIGHFKSQIIRFQMFGLTLMDLRMGIEQLIRATELHDQLVDNDHHLLSLTEFTKLESQYFYGATLFLQLVDLLDWSCPDNAQYKDKLEELGGALKALKPGSEENQSALDHLWIVTSKVLLRNEINEIQDVLSQTKEVCNKLVMAEEAISQIEKQVNTGKNQLAQARRQYQKMQASWEKQNLQEKEPPASDPRNSKASTQAVNKSGKSKTPSWQKQRKQANTAFLKKNYSKAIKSYSQAISHCQGPEKTFLLIERADVRHAILNDDIHEVIQVMGQLGSYHKDFRQACLAPSPHRLTTTRQQIMDSSARFVELANQHTRTIEEILKEQQEAHGQLHFHSARTDDSSADVEGNIWFLGQSIQYLVLLQDQLRKGFEDIEQILLLRSGWLKGLANRNALMQKKDGAIPDLLKRLDKALSYHRSVMEQTIVFQNLLKPSLETLVAPVKSDIEGHSPPGYQRINIRGDGNCLFSAMGIALNRFENSKRYTQAEARRLIHDLLQKVVSFASGSEELQTQLTTLLGQSIDLLQISVNFNTLLKGAQQGLCAEGVLQQYGESTMTALIPLLYPVQFSVTSDHDSQPQVNGLNLWLRYARTLLKKMIEAGVVSLDHWPQSHLLLQALESQEMADALAQQIEQMNQPFLLEHSNSNPLLQHFNLAINPELLHHFPITIPIPGNFTASEQASVVAPFQYEIIGSGSDL